MRLRNDRDRLDIALHATMNDLVEWGDWIREVRGNGRYQVGITGDAWPVAILRFRCVDNGTDSIQVFDYEPWSASIRDMRSRGFYVEVFEAMNDAFYNWSNRLQNAVAEVR